MVKCTSQLCFYLWINALELVGLESFSFICVPWAFSFSLTTSNMQSISEAQARRFTKFRERRSLIEKDVVWTVSLSESCNCFYVISENSILALLAWYSFLLTFFLVMLVKVRTDRSVSYFDGDDNPHLARLRDILLTYSFYNFDLGYCQVRCNFHPSQLLYSTFLGKSSS